MQQAKPLNLPNPPKQYTNPLQQGDMNYQSQTAHNLVGGNFGGDLSWLQPTMNINNGANALSAAQGLLQPQFRDTLQKINNNAAANNQLNSSTYTDALARSQSDLNSQYQSILSQQAINDANQSNANRLNLFGTGLNTLQQGIGNEQQDSNATNSFNLNNYNNQVAQAIQQNQNANRANGFSQFLGLTSPLGHDYLQSTGINSVPGYGVGQTAQILGSVAGFGGGGGGSFGGGLGQGQNRITGQPSYAPGSSAFNSFNPGPANYYNPLYGQANTPGLYQ